MYQGSCFCGAIEYRIEARPKSITHCHCSMCRKVHGAAFASYVAVPLRAFHWTKGAQEVVSFRSSESVIRSFCPKCGSPLCRQDVGAFKDWISVAIANLDSAADYMPQQHAYVWNKVNWYEIRDHFQRHRFAAPVLTSRA
jgi:hypothetical protein